MSRDAPAESEKDDALLRKAQLSISRTNPDAIETQTEKLLGD